MRSAGSRGGRLDPSSRVPLHAQIASILRDQIRDRSLAPGDALPTEAQLQEDYSVSRSVARQAMVTLVNEGLAVRGRGRGSAVAPTRQHHRLVHRAAGLSSQISATGVSTTTEILHLGLEEKPHNAAALPGDRVYRLERLRSIGSKPAAYIRTWLPQRYGRELTVDELTDASLHDALFAHYGVRLTGGSRQVRAVAADETLAQLLELRPGAPLLLLEGQTTDRDGEIVEVFATWHDGELIAFDIEVDEASSGPFAQQPNVPDGLGRAEQLARQLLDELEHSRSRDDVS